MGNILTYLKENGNLTFCEMAFTPVDALILAQFAYFNFDGLVPAPSSDALPATMSYIRQHANYEQLFSVNWYKDELRAFFEELVTGKRFRNMKVTCYVNDVEEEKQTQFSAVTFLLGDGSVVIAFRGTDDALSGWKEDLNMAYLTPIPSQEMSKQYIDYIAERYKRKRKGNIYITGHSKGGNLAVYAAMNCNDRWKSRINCIYNLDGPGFRPEFLEKMDYASVKSKVRKLIPQSSFVGMVLQQDKDYEVVESNLTGMIQHLPLAWKVVGRDFVYRDEIDESRKVLNDEINEWILSLDKEQLSTFLETMYELIDSTNTSSLKELGEDWLNHVITIFHFYKNNRFEEKNKEIFWESASLLLKLIVEDGAEKIRRIGILQGFKERIENLNKKETST